MFRDDIDFDVDAIAGFTAGERSVFVGMGNDGDGDIRAGDLRNGEADAIDGNGALLDEVTFEAIR